jgi:predicted SpoU family rRNA methylase
MSLKNLIEHEKWTFAHKNEASCPTTYDVQRYRDVREHNASIDYILGAAEKVITERDQLLEEVRDLIKDYGSHFDERVTQYYSLLLKKYDPWNE